jgi:hypothetical protein
MQMNFLSMALEPLSQELKDIIVGTLLGDSKMTFSNLGNAAFVYELGALHKEFLFFVFGLFGAYISKQLPVEYNRLDKRTGRTHTSYYFSTVTSSLFYPFAAMFYVRVPGTRKVIKVLPSTIYELLTPRALAY